MSDTINNGIPFVPENTIDPAAGLNESLLIIDRLLQLKVLGMKVNTPAVGPVAGDRYIVGTSPTGAWAGKALQVAEWMPDGYWGFSPASVAVYGTSIYINTGTDWVPASAGAGASWGGITGNIADQADLAAALAAKREVLTANRTYYVRTDGSDSNTGLVNTAGGAFLTIQRAVDVAASLDLSVYSISIRCTGTFTDMVTLKTLVGSGTVSIRGDQDNTTTAGISTVSADCFYMGPGGFYGTYEITHLKLQTAVSGYAMRGAGGGGGILYGNIDFGACAQGHVLMNQGQQARMIGPVTISGATVNHVYAVNGGSIAANGQTMTMLGTPSFSVAFALSDRVGSINLANNTFIGAATGVRYRATLNGVIYVSGAGASYLPGDSAGVQLNGGQYA